MGLRDKLPRISRRQGIATFKSCLAYTLTFVLIFIRPFSRLNEYPVTLSSMVLVSIAGQAGLSTGACWSQDAMGILGVAVGSAGFAILAKLGHSHVAQGFIFWIFVYFLALIKARSMRYFVFSLLAIVMSFNGIYTSSVLDQAFHAAYLEAYIEAYFWGFAIVLGINLLIFPISSERELREVLVVSLERVSALSHLLAKTYTLELTDEERAAREELNQSMRQDMGLLNVKLAQTGLEINLSKWAMQDYSMMVSKLRQMQQGLITCYSSLIAMAQYDPKALRVIQHELIDAAATEAFTQLRRGADLSFQDVVTEMAVGKHEYQSPAPGLTVWDDFRDGLEDDDVEGGRGRAFFTRRTAQEAEAVQVRTAAVAEKLKKDVASAGDTRPGSRRPSVSGVPVTVADTMEKDTLPVHSETPVLPKPPDGDAFLRNSWALFTELQQASISRMLAEGVPNDIELRLHQPGPSIHERYLHPTETFNPHVAQATAARLTQTEARRRTNPKDSDGPSQTAGEPTSSRNDGDRVDEYLRTSERICGTAIMRCFAFLSGMGQAVEALADLYDYIVPNPHMPPRRKKLRFHLFERKGPKLPSSDKSSRMSLREAIAKLSGRDFVPRKTSVWRLVAGMERLLRSATSVYAAKTASAVAVFAVFILAPSLKSFFISYGLTSGVITLVVAMAPVLGQTLLTFVLQICGTGFGTVYALLALRIFLDVGGFHFNPYGLVCLLALFSIPLCTIIYTKPQYFTGALLALNGAGVLVVTEWTYTEVPGQIRPGFDSPAYRAAKQLVSMCIALAIAALFQIFILRLPARQSLREKLARVCWSLSASSVLFSIYVDGVMPLEPNVAELSLSPAKKEAAQVVRQELIARELQNQNDLLALMPLMRFASVEPTFGRPFKAGPITRVIRAHQLILDRLRESRCAIGTDGFAPEIRRHFGDALMPYRKEVKEFSRALFYLVATSLSTKQPLPSLPSMVSTARNVQHDALVLSHRLVQTEEGRAIIHSSALHGYWFYLVAYTSISYLLEGMEGDLRELFGQVEESPFVEDARGWSRF
ncbi:hypothetical protein JCM1840_000049 [Sporobolomyces johnsonii]